MKKSLEHHFSMLVREIRKEYVGNGPKEIKTRIVGPWAISEMRGNITHVEKFMAHSEEGKRMVHEARTRMVKEIYKNPVVTSKLEELTQAKFVTIFTDINIDMDLAMTIFMFDRPIEPE